MRHRAFTFFLTAPLVAALLAAAGTPSAKEAFLKEEADWRAGREAKLKAPDGWLSLAGLFWLREGSMAAGSDPKSDIVLPAGAPKRAGIFQMKAGVVSFGTRMALKPDTDDHPDVIQVGSIALTIIQRGGKTGVRVRDPDAATRRDFTGCKWFPAAQQWRVKAKWVAYPEPKKIKITNILGMTDDEPAPGYAEFTINGKTLRLEPVEEDGELSFMFKDATSGVTTYGPGRYLKAAIPKGNVVVLDFNQAYNPPCVFTAFATCPLPPKQNVLPVAVEAGEKKYGEHSNGSAH